MNPNELNALISLLDDPDEGVFSHIKTKIVSLGNDVIPVLENAWEHSFNPLLQTRIEHIIHTIQFQKISESLRHWAQNSEQSLLEGALLVAQYQYPDLDTAKLSRQLEQIKHDIWLELNDNLTALERTKVINHILFDVHQYSGNTANYYAPQNSYLNNVIESKKGNPLSLSIIYAIIAQSLGLPVYGVNLPEHFILAYKDESIFFPTFKASDSDKSSVLFYINPFSRGAVFGRKEIDAFLKQLKLEPKPEHYNVCSNLDIIKRLIRNLINSYEKLGYPDKSLELETLLNSISNQF
jgi:regulator of sirC expression with transglutaminase-like and TPR domain